MAARKKARGKVPVPPVPPPKPRGTVEVVSGGKCKKAQDAAKQPQAAKSKAEAKPTAKTDPAKATPATPPAEVKKKGAKKKVKNTRKRSKLGKVSEGTRKRAMPRPKRTKPKSKATYIDDPLEPLRCHAARKTDGARCGQPSIVGSPVCRFHGGKSTGRPCIHGGYSQSLIRLKTDYEAGLANEEMLYSLSETLALSHAVLERTARRAEEADTPELRQRALKLINKAMDPEVDAQTAGQALSNLRRLLRDGAKEDRALQHFSDAIEKMALRKEKAWDVRLKAAHAMNENDLVGVFSRIITLAADELGIENARRLSRRFIAEGIVPGSGSGEQ